MLEKYCSSNDIEIIDTIPYDTELGLANSKGLVASAEYNSYLELFRLMLETIEKEVQV